MIPASRAALKGSFGAGSPSFRPLFAFLLAISFRLSYAFHEQDEGAGKAAETISPRGVAMDRETTERDRRGALVLRERAQPGRSPRAERVDSARRCAPALLAARTEDQHEAARLIAGFGPFLLGGGRLYCLDGGNVFNPYRLAAWVRRRGVDPATALERVQVSRAYTCHQLLGAVEAMLPKLLEHEPPPPVLLLGVDRLFLDEDLALWERRWLFGRIIEEAERLGRRGLPMVVTLTSLEGTPWARWVTGKARILSGPGGELSRLPSRLVAKAAVPHSELKGKSD